MRRFSLIPTLFAIMSFLFVSCFGSRSESLVIEDIGSDQSFTVKSGLYQLSGVYKRNVKIVGFVDDTVRINGWKIGPGEVNIDETTDFYSEDMLINFYSLGADSGRLELNLTWYH